VIALVILVGMCAGGAASASTGAEDDPTAVVLREVRATAIPGERSIEVFWATGSEADVAGFNVMRGTSDAGPWEQANENAHHVLLLHPGNYGFRRYVQVP